MINWLKSLYWRWRVQRMIAGPILEIEAVYVGGKRVA